jgi:hypothetical protein
VPDASPKAEWFQPTVDVLALMHQQARRVQRTRVRNALMRAGISAASRSGAYCSIDDVPASNCRNERVSVVGEPTRLLALSDSRQEELIGSGYAACDAACQRWLPADMLRPQPHSAHVATTQEKGSNDNIASGAARVASAGLR